MTTPTNDTQLREEFDKWREEYFYKDSLNKDPSIKVVAEWFLSKIHSARKEAQMELLDRMNNRIVNELIGDCMKPDDRLIGYDECRAIIQSERESVNNT